MTRVTLDVLERTIFTHGLDRDPDALSRAITRFFEAVGPIDPLDVLRMPRFSAPDRAPACPPGHPLLRGGGRRTDYPPPHPDRERCGCTAGSAHPAARGARSGDRGAARRDIRPGQYRHLHRRWSRNHRQCADLEPLSARPRAGNGRRRSARRPMPFSATALPRRRHSTSSSIPAPSWKRRCGSTRRCPS